jgi:hypothetical protein
MEEGSPRVFGVGKVVKGAHYSDVHRGCRSGTPHPGLTDAIGGPALL